MINMAGWEIFVDQSGNPILPVGAALSGRRLALKSGPNTNHPGRSIANGAVAFARAYQDAVAAIDAWRSIGASDEKSASNVRATFETLCYKTAEYLDAYFELPKSVLAMQARPQNSFVKDFIVVAKSCARDWNLVCNRIKHNQNVLVPSVRSYRSPFGTLELFSLLEPNGVDALSVNHSFHKDKERCRPFAVALRQMLHDVIRADRAASKLLLSLPEDPASPALPNYILSLNVLSAMKMIEKWPLWALPAGKSSVDSFEIGGGSMRSVRLFAIKRHEASEVRATYLADGVTRLIPLI